MIGLIRFILLMSVLLFFGGTGWLYLKDKASAARYANAAASAPAVAPADPYKAKRVPPIYGDAAASAPRRGNVEIETVDTGNLRAQSGPSGAKAGERAGASAGARLVQLDENASKTDARAGTEGSGSRTGPDVMTGSVAADRAPERRPVDQSAAAQPVEPGEDGDARRLSRQRAAAEARPVPGPHRGLNEAPAIAPRADTQSQARRLKDVIDTFNGRAVRDPDQSEQPDAPGGGGSKHQRDGKVEPRDASTRKDRRAAAAIAPVPSPKPQLRGARVAARGEVPVPPAIEPQPARRPEDTHRSVPGTPHHYVVRRGDTLWTIAERLLGRGYRYTRIYRANRKHISDPNLIFPAQRFELPPRR